MSIQVVFRKNQVIESTVEYTDAEVQTYGRDTIVLISDQTIELSNQFDSYRIVEVAE